MTKAIKGSIETGFISYGKDFEFYSERVSKPSERFNQRSDTG